MKKRFLQYLFLTCSVMVLLSACRKDQFKTTETLQSGKTFVWITEGNGDPYIQYFDVFSDIKTVVLFTVRRDAANNADLQKAITVTLTAQTDSATNGGLTPFTSDLYTAPSDADLASGGLFLGNEGITQTATGYTIKFAPGEFAKSIIYKIDGSKLNLANTYGSVYKITDAGGFTPKVGFDVVAAGVAVKNQWDGVYNYTGTMVRNTDGGGGTQGPPDTSLGGTIVDGVTTDVKTTGPFTDGITFYWATGGGISGIDGTKLTIDPTTNKVTVTSSNATMKNISGMENSYDPATKTFTLNVGWGVFPTTREAHLVLTYSGSR